MWARPTLICKSSLPQVKFASPSKSPKGSLLVSDRVAAFVLLCRACPVGNPHGPGGGEPVPPLHREPEAAGGVHRQTALLPAGEGVQHQPFPAGGEPLGVQWD